MLAEMRSPRRFLEALELSDLPALAHGPALKVPSAKSSRQRGKCTSANQNLKK
jgi:hypothetical protein